MPVDDAFHICLVIYIHTFIWHSCLHRNGTSLGSCVGTSSCSSFNALQLERLGNLFCRGSQAQGLRFPEAVRGPNSMGFEGLTPLISFEDASQRSSVLLTL